MPAWMTCSKLAHPYARALIGAVPAMHPPEPRRGVQRRLAGDFASAAHPPSDCRLHAR
jgi:ABC-type dipeptide/oligopeptide/nickel transport system ATPase component